MTLRLVVRTLVSMLFLMCFDVALSGVSASASTWFPLGPYGGDARTIVADSRDPNHLYLGTATGWVLTSRDGGKSWTRVAQISKRNDLVVDHIVVDPRNSQRLIVGAFIIDRPDGGLFISDDGGKSWYEQAEMRGQSVRSMARSLSDPNVIVVGTLQGVYQSSDNGRHWTGISPAGSTEIHEVESIAIDPVDPHVIYAGTWHLPWKTTDGGAHWVNIKEGIIDDSDVFSIIIDPKNPNIVFASACSGIYKSVTAAMPNPRDLGKRFDKVNGIPSTARRTRKLMQDPAQGEVVYAGTTQGLYKTLDGGAQWKRMTGDDVIVNDVFVDPKDTSHVLLATDRGGVLSSHDGGASFESSNTGFSARQVTAYASDPNNRSVAYVGVVNDKESGGVFQSLDGGVHWVQQSVGLGGRDVFSLLTADDGTLLAGTGHGVFRLESGAWADSSALLAASTPPPAAPAAVAKPKPAVTKTVHGKPVPKTKAKPRPVAPRPATVAVGGPRRLSDAVYAMVAGSRGVYAGTSAGLMLSDRSGKTWSPVSSLQMPDLRFIAVKKSTLMVAGFKRIELSLDDGATWDSVALPPDLTQVGAIALDELNNMWVGGREGAYYSTDYGLTWKSLPNLNVTQVDNMYYDNAEHRLLVTASNATVLFTLHLPDYFVNYYETGWKLRFARPAGDHMIAATLFDGMVVQPVMVDSSLVGGK